MKFNCPVCGKAIKVKDNLAGRKGRCPACQTALVVPQPAPPKAAFNCPGCGKKIKSKPELAGRKVKCPACDEVFTMPGPAGEEAGASAIIKPSPSAPTLPPPLPIGSDKLMPPKNKGAATNMGVHRQWNVIPGPDPSSSFLARLFYATPTERKEIYGLILGAATLGGIIGYFWGGLYNPFPKEGILSALLNIFLFGGWGFAESLGLLLARNIGRTTKRVVLMLCGATCGGLWGGGCKALDLAAGPAAGDNSLFFAGVGLVEGFILFGVISLLSVIGLSKQMTSGGD